MCIVQEDGKTYWSASHWGMHEITRDEHANTVGRLKAEVRAHMNMHREDNNFFNAFKKWGVHHCVCRSIAKSVCKILSSANVS